MKLSTRPALALAASVSRKSALFVGRRVLAVRPSVGSWQDQIQARSRDQKVACGCTVAIRKMLVCLLVFVLASPGFGQTPASDQKQINSVRKKVAECLEKQRMVFVETHDNRRLQGSITEAGMNDFTLSYASWVQTLSYADVKTIRWRSPIVRQVKLIAGAAALTAAIWGFFVLIGGLKG